jgi:hypothetical protein
MAERQDEAHGSGSSSPSGAPSSNVDQFLPAKWEPHVVQALSAWKQGDLIEGVPRFWSIPAGPDQVIEFAHGDVDWEVFETEVIPGWVIILTQTCDIAAAGPGQRQPFIQVSPIFRFPEGYDASKIESVFRWEVTYLAPVTAPPGDGIWGVDLRLSMPASKGILLNKSSKSGFVTETDALNFGEAIAARMRRPALHEALSYDLPRSIDALIADSDKAQPEWWEHVEQVRISIHGDRIAPTSVTPIVIEVVRLEPSERKIWRDWQKRLRRQLQKTGIRLHPVQFGSLDSISARLYKESVPVRISKLGRAPNW